METVSYGLSVSAVGMATVFVGLIILIILIKGMQKAKPSVTQQKKQADAPSIVIQTSNVNDDAIVAVIAAAVSAVMEDAQKGMPEGKKGFVVRSIRRVSSAPAWNRAGREEQVYSRL